MSRQVELIRGEKVGGTPRVPRNMTDRAPQDPAVESDGRIGVQTVFEQPLDPTGTNGSAGVMFY